MLLRLCSLFHALLSHNPNSVRVGNWKLCHGYKQKSHVQCRIDHLWAVLVCHFKTQLYVYYVNVDFGCICAYAPAMEHMDIRTCVSSFYASAFPQIIILIILRHLFCSVITDPHFDPITGHVPLPPARRVTGESVKTNRTSQDYDQLPPSSGKVENCSCRKLQLHEAKNFHPWSPMRFLSL